MQLKSIPWPLSVENLTLVESVSTRCPRPSAERFNEVPSTQRRAFQRSAFDRYIPRGSTINLNETTESRIKCVCFDNVLTTGNGILHAKRIGFKPECVKHGIWLTHWDQDKIVAIFQTKFANAFSWMKMYKFILRFQCISSQGSD